MRKYIFAFLMLVGVILSTVPLVNFFKAEDGVLQKLRSVESIRRTLYSMDFVLPYIGKLYYWAGLSLDPESVMVGKSGWLFLGDGYAKTLTVKRFLPTDVDEVLAKNIIANAQDWNSWFVSRGVRAYRIVIGPDKDSIYTEYLPDWAKPSLFTITDQIADIGGEALVIFPKRQLMDAKDRFTPSLYYKTDTHWNLIGGSIAFEQLMQSLSSVDASIHWPAPIVDRDISVVARGGGDLSRFQRINQLISDDEIVLRAPLYPAGTIHQYEYKSKKPIAPLLNGDVRILTTPTLVVSDNALNKVRVLWLRDSFGTAMTPFMAATFSEVLQVHNSVSTPEMVKDLTIKFKPDYVVETTVERSVRREFLIRQP
ncbi:MULTISPECIES: alginate O-acetyltransferase AlgX-related protein [Pseudomonas]|uniref:alginate O-acetyltransferase AlgX-related protein n=1 Tax=Pseudomonas TaxID=286 RepID=UPI00111A6873|nr:MULTISPECIES: hypothetical protein [Pseudomonas]MCO7538109.1 hypothetical protein [Pseudomonas asiatica]MCO7552009.1 hypothetical protein [Pseudomonas asiatica]MCO7562961.1 hypothetical protein [Pseudomonas asiatica]